jgi:hypothetical protein
MIKILALQRMRSQDQPTVAISTSSLNCHGVVEPLESTCSINC